MAGPIKTIETEALRLSERECAELARVLLLSLEVAEDQEAELVWAREAERRYQELKTEAVQAIPSQRVLDEARSR